MGWLTPIFAGCRLADRRDALGVAALVARGTGVSWGCGATVGQSEHEFVRPLASRFDPLSGASVHVTEPSGSSSSFDISSTGPRPSAGSADQMCPTCGSGVQPGLPFCPSCGKRVTATKSGPACPRCGIAVAAGAKFCAACGLQLDRPAPGSATPAAPPKGDVRYLVAVLDESGNVLSRHPLGQGESTIGRDGATLEFPDDAFMSPLHAKLTDRGGPITLRDLGSRNGTWVFVQGPHRLVDGDLLLIGSQLLLFRRLGYPGPHPPERDATRRMGSLVPSADIARVTQLRSDGSERDVLHLSPGRDVIVGRERGDWVFPYDPSMSGQHAEIRSEDADFVVLDKNSRNGVAVAVRGEVEIGEGSRILVGDKLLRVDKP